MKNFFKFLFVGLVALVLVVQSSQLEAARIKKQATQSRGGKTSVEKVTGGKTIVVAGQTRRRVNIPLRQIKRLLANPQPDSETWNTQVKQSIALLKARKPIQAEAFQQRYLAIATKGKMPATVVPEVVVEADVEIIEETVPEFQQQVQKLAEDANLSGDALKQFQAFADIIQSINSIKQEFKDKGFDIEALSWEMMQTIQEQELELWNRYQNAQSEMFRILMSLGEKIRADEDFSKIQTLVNYAAVVSETKEVLAPLDNTQKRSLIEKTKQMINDIAPYYQLIGIMEPDRPDAIPDMKALDNLVK